MMPFVRLLDVPQWVALDTDDFPSVLLPDLFHFLEHQLKRHFSHIYVKTRRCKPKNLRINSHMAAT